MLRSRVDSSRELRIEKFFAEKASGLARNLEAANILLIPLYQYLPGMYVYLSDQFIEKRSRRGEEREVLRKIIKSGGFAALTRSLFTRIVVFVVVVVVFARVQRSNEYVYIDEWKPLTPHL